MTAAAPTTPPTTARPLPWWKTHWKALVVLGLVALGFAVFRPSGDAGRARAMAVMQRPGVSLVNVGYRLESAKFELHPGLERAKGNLGWAFHQLARFPEVTQVDTDYFMKVNLSTLKQLPNLESFAVNKSSELEDDDLATFRGLPNLKSLSLIGDRITPRAIRHLEGMPHLKSLKLSGQKMVGEGFESVSRIPNLETLVVDGGRGEWKAPLKLGAARKLKTLKFSALGARPRDLELTPELESLEELSVGETPLDRTFFRRLAALPNLRVLKVRNCSRSLDDCMDEIARLPKLESLSLGSPSQSEGFRLVTAQGLDRLSRSSTLRELSIFGAPFGDEGVKKIAAMKKLRKLALSQVNMTSAAFDDVLDMTGLEQVSLREANFFGRLGNPTNDFSKFQRELEKKNVQLIINRGWWGLMNW